MYIYMYARLQHVQSVSVPPPGEEQAKFAWREANYFVGERIEHEESGRRGKAEWLDKEANLVVIRHDPINLNELSGVFFNI